MGIVWNPQAIANLKSIENYHKDMGLGSGRIEELISGIFSAVERLHQHPESGRIVPEINDPDFREVIWKNWRIIYLLDTRQKQIEILNVLHSAQQLGSIGQ
ncbi:MAG: type II toxin-antitoxin system RelE/ParE family toxin [Balneolaceae bacterium]|nr:type II toxin-antitoxin system RelE/ParE family toxin [Balneolaceae bacterium]